MLFVKKEHLDLTTIILKICLSRVSIEFYKKKTPPNNNETMAWQPKPTQNKPYVN